MKCIKLLTLFLLLSCPAIGQVVEFDTSGNSWLSILKKSKELNKPVFVDVYTDWCSPCKKMDKEVFIKKEVGLFYNNNFLAVKINAEKNYGISFARDYKINAYPTFIYFSPEGKVLLAGTGYQSSEGFIIAGKQALTNWKEGINIEDMKKIIASGNFDTKFLMNYIRKLSSLQLPNSLIIEQYLKVIPDDSLYTQHTLDLVRLGYFGRMSHNSKAFQVLFHAYRKYPIKSFELLSPWNTIRNRLLDYVDSAGILHDSLWLKEILETNEKLDTVSKIAIREKLYLLCRYYSGSNDTVSLLKCAIKFAHDHLIQINADSLYKKDSLYFNYALDLKAILNNGYKTNRIEEASNFRKSFFSESRLLTTEILEIIKLIQKAGIMKENPDLFSHWLTVAISLYEKNPLFVNVYLLKSLKKEVTALNGLILKESER